MHGDEPDDPSKKPRIKDGIDGGIKDKDEGMDIDDLQTLRINFLHLAGYLDDDKHDKVDKHGRNNEFLGGLSHWLLGLEMRQNLSQNNVKLPGRHRPDGVGVLTTLCSCLPSEPWGYCCANTQNGHRNN